MIDMPLHPIARFKRLFVKPISQSNESFILKKLISWHPQVSETFVEVGFSPWEFNCCDLSHYQGLLIDCNTFNCSVGRAILPPNINIINEWITLDNVVDVILSSPLSYSKIGVLSIDLDGNDYWFLEKLLSFKPDIFIAEYNSSFGHNCVTVKYDSSFNRLTKHPSARFYGASLSALVTLGKRFGYSLVELSASGVNAFFIRNDLLVDSDTVLDQNLSFREKYYYDNSRHLDQYSDFPIDELVYIR